MAGTLVAEHNQGITNSKTQKAVGVIGVPLAYGASMAGVELGPAALRVARLNKRIKQLGYKVRDLGDLHVQDAQSAPEPGDKLKYLGEISAACQELAQRLRKFSTPASDRWSLAAITQSPSVLLRASRHTAGNEMKLRG